MSRRIRSDIESRDFHCPCGRSYLSYSALHTHIKKYHQKEENMLQRAVIPQRAQHKRGRPSNKQELYINEELEELTHFQTAVLGIYQELQPIAESPILLEGNEELELQAYDREYEQLLQEEAHHYSDMASEKTLRECECNIRTAIAGLSKHFAARVSARIKLMLVVGYLEFYLNSSPKEECMVKMGWCGWGNASTRLSQLLYDVLMRALQRHPHRDLVLTSNEE